MLLLDSARFILGEQEHLRRLYGSCEEGVFLRVVSLDTNRPVSQEHAFIYQTCIMYI